VGYNFLADVMGLSLFL